jgi:hypothetical protein
MLHYSVGDSSRDWMRENRDTPLVIQIRDRLDNQGFLSSGDFISILGEAIIANLTTASQNTKTPSLMASQDLSSNWTL